MEEGLRRLQWTCCTFARRHFCEVVQFLMQWLVEADAAASAVASWVGAHQLVSIFQEAHESEHEIMAQTDAAHLETAMELVMDRCVQVFHGEHAAAQAMATASSFFPFKSIQSPRLAQPPTDAMLLTERAVAKWRCVVAWVARYSLTPIRARVQRELLTKSPPSCGSDAARAHPLLTNLSDLRLGLTTRTLLRDAPMPFTHRLKDTAVFLKQCTWCCTSRRKLRAISDLHALAMKYSTKKASVAVAWELRVAVLSLVPNDIFGRYWKDDMHSLLRLQCQHNKDGSTSARAATLASIGLCFSQLLRRHFAIERKLPSELDCMEVINTTQAWCFFSFSPKQKPSLQAFKDRTLPILVDLTLGIAAHNMTYAVQSHLRRLPTEPNSVFDERGLVGLEALLAICQHCLKKSACNQEPSVAATAAITSILNKKTLAVHHPMLGGLVGHILIECNTQIGHELLLDTHGRGTDLSSSSSGAPSSQSASSSSLSVASTLLSTRSTRDGNKRAIAIHTYGAALRSLEFVYTTLELREEQTVLLLARACIHVEPHVRQCAHHAFHCIVSMKPKAKTTEKSAASAVFRGLTDFLLWMTGNHAIAKNDIEASITLIRLLGRCYCARRDCLLQATAASVDAVCVYLLINGDIELRTNTFETLQAVRKARHAQMNDYDSLRSRSCCVLDVIDHSWPSTAIVNQLHDLVKQFVWGSRNGKPAKPWMKEEQTELKKMNGGLSVPNIRTELMTMSATAVSKWAITTSHIDQVIGEILLHNTRASSTYITPLDATPRRPPQLHDNMWTTGAALCASLHSRPYEPRERDNVRWCYEHFKSTIVQAQWDGDVLQIDLSSKMSDRLPGIIAERRKLRGTFCAEWLPYMTSTADGWLLDSNGSLYKLAHTSVSVGTAQLGDILRWEWIRPGVLNFISACGISGFSRPSIRALERLCATLVSNFPQLLYRPQQTNVLRLYNGQRHYNHEWHLHTSEATLTHVDTTLAKATHTVHSAMDCDIMATRDLNGQKVSFHAHLRFTRIVQLWGGSGRYNTTRSFYRQQVAATRTQIGKDTRDTAVNKAAHTAGSLWPGLQLIQWSELHNIPGITAYTVQTLLRLKANRLSMWN
ncbi:hypothetical protein FI667_g4160, partial [Globisporangium splendens]